MVQKEVVITNSLGIHARPAVMIVKTASQFAASITISKDGIAADAKSIMSIMMLAASHKSKVVIKATGKDETEAVEALVNLFQGNFNDE
ncbi:MAG: HPr family phosphocarrier protein [Chitinivibrionales bacterium]|nr:HPr family phosphocarrier protein [Chitinivibrionales bacterium]